ncbi:MAG: hypothetical protein H8M99_01055, partial [Gloeobacteraceae cyanobacterium ES-bin-144]|nr:hypothetical protein [Verrucomicrobiales bacterium]
MTDIEHCIRIIELHQYTDPIPSNDRMSPPSPNTFIMRYLPLFLSSVLVGFTSAQEPNFMQTSDGLVVIEAEHFQTHTPQGSYTWAAQPNEKASGGQIVKALPESKESFLKPEDFTTKAPKLDYKVTFLAPGRYYVWVKAQGAFVHLGLNGKPGANSQRMGGFPGNTLEWRNQCRATYGQPGFLDITQVGENTIHLWMFQGGNAVDQILLTPLADFKPSNDTNLPESPRGKLPPQPPQVNAGPHKEINPPQAAVTLEGAATDFDSKVQSYSWSQVNGPAIASISTPSAPTTRVDGLTALGNYQFRLTAKDDGGLSASRDVTVKVTPAVPPTVSVPADITLITDTALDISPTASDADSDVKIHPLTFNWEQISGPSQAKKKILNQSTLSLSGLIDGTYIFRFSATDFTGNTSFAEAKVIKRPVPAQTSIDATDSHIQYIGRFNEIKPKDVTKPVV